MTASLRVKNDKYYVVLTHTTDGKKNQTWVSTGLSVTGNEGKARQIMLDMLGDKPEQAAPPDILFSDAVRRWLEDVRHRVDEVTYQGYEVQARAHILPYFDDLQIRLCDVDVETLQTYINVKAKFGRSDGHGGLSAVQFAPAQERAQSDAQIGAERRSDPDKSRRSGGHATRGAVYRHVLHRSADARPADRR